MKVRLTYAAELDKLSENLVQIAGENIQPLQDTIDLLKATIEVMRVDKLNSIQFVDYGLDKVRKKLSTIDESLAEISMLVSGYIEATKPAPPRTVSKYCDTPQTEPKGKLGSE